MDVLAEMIARLYAAPVPAATEPAPIFRARVGAGRTRPAAPPPVATTDPPAEVTTLTGAVAALRRGEVSSVELVSAALAAGDAADPELGIFMSRYPEAALAAAERIDGDLAAGNPVGPLGGVPLGIKDLLTTVDGPTSAGSLVPPAVGRRDAAAVGRLRDAGGIIVGKTVTSEYGVGSPDLTKPFPVPRNPWDTARWTGGSSGGAASGLIAGAFLGGLGTDSGGSIRMPSAFCGVTGLKPTYGRVPRAGGIPMGWTTDHIGPMTTSARDCALLLEVIAGAHPDDASTSDRPVPRYTELLTDSLEGVRIGVDRLDRVSGAIADPALATLFSAALAELTALGADLVEVELPLWDEMVAVSTVIILSEALAYHHRNFDTRSADYFANTRATVGMAKEFSAADYVQAQRVRSVGQQAVAALLDTVDLIVTPTAAVAATRYDRLDQMFESGEFHAVYAPYWNVMGNPALSVPMGFTADGLPMGLQLIGAAFDDATVLRAGAAYQSRTDWHRRGVGLRSAGGAQRGLSGATSS